MPAPDRSLLDPAAVAEALELVATGAAGLGDLKLLVKHFLAVLEEGAPGGSVEVRVPPYAAVQVVEGVRHTRGTPPAVIVLMSSWIALATGGATWPEAVESGAVRASGERTDLSARLPRRRDPRHARLGWPP